MRFAPILGLLSMVLACGGKRDGEFKELAARANPVILKLRQAAAVVLDPAKRTDLDAIDKACLEGVEIARPLALVHFHDALKKEGDKVGIDDIMPLFANDPSVYCKDAKKNIPDEMCRDWCVGVFTDLSDAIDRVSTRAREVGVTIEPLHK